uniref:Putative cadherin egf lag seven-pass g-type receptor n=1 Tax=Panstrongylus lignarius TaxID=156445 RepID=A0A224X4K1_9HEMI
MGGRWLVPLAGLLLTALAGNHGALLQFSKPAYNATIYENSRGKTYVRCVEKMGIDNSGVNADIRYKIVGGDRDKFFKAEEKTVGAFVMLMIRTRTGNTDVLNRERKDKYTLHIRATITKRSNRQEQDTTVYISILDRNDLNPLFYPTTYDEVVPEDTPLHKNILKVNAEDADLGMNGELYFYFKNKTDQFSVHPTTGIVSLTRPLRYSDNSVHHLTIVAKDRGGGKPSFGKITFHVKQVNLFGPEIYVHTLTSLSENTDNDVYAIVRVIDQDEGVHGEIKSLEIVEGDPDGNFVVGKVKEGKTGYEFNIELLHTLSSDIAPKGFNLTLKATDNGSPPKHTYKSVPVLITNVNDNPPVFDRDFYEVDISENVPPNSPIIRVKVIDSDNGNNVIPNFEITTNTDLFTVNPTTGMIYTADWLDTERTSSYTLTVIATDRAVLGSRKHSTAKVKVNVIDANDNDPVFEDAEVTVYVDENEPSGTSVTTVIARDDDSGENSYISYSIANLKSVPFEIDHFSGIVRTTQVLDYESLKRNFILKIRASDWGLPYRRQTEMQLKIIVRDVNDNRPQFEKIDCVGHVPKFLTIGTELLTLSAIDFDAGNMISYRLLSGNEDDCFHLDATTGVLSVTCDLSDLNVSQRELNVTATDHTHYADTMNIMIKLISVKKNTNMDPKSWFKCKDTGVARRLTEILASAEKNNMNKEEFAMMPSRYGQNAHSPEFKDFPVQVLVNESVAIGTTLIVIKATDRDLGYNGKLIFGITSGDSDSVFRIDPDTGELKVVGYLDREREDEYFLNITVYDLGRPKKSTSRYLPFTVLDVNDNSPKFEKSIASFRVTENAMNGTAIYTVNASDSDLGENGKILFSIVSDSPEFYIDPITGVLSVRGVLDREVRQLHELIIRATDCAGTLRRDAHFADCIVKIYVDDVNDNAPKFSGDKFKISIPEDIPVGTVVAIISATDPDLDEGGKITYSLLDDSDTFEIDPLTGTVRTSKFLDYEQRQYYSLTVQAEDNGVPSLTSETLLMVDLIDVNENEHAPFFSDIVVSASVKEALPADTLVTTVTAVDIDPPGTRDSTLVYRIVSGDGLGYFRIDNEGNIRTTRILDAESKSGYWLTVVAEDQGLVPQHALLQVYIEVIDVNDQVPLSLKAVYHATVTEESESIVSVVQVKAKDEDLTPAHITYSISAGNPHSFFTINSTTGLITTTGRKLDREDQEEHILEVTISDNGHPSLTSTTRVVVSVEDINDNDPLFDQAFYQVTVPETKVPDSFVSQSEESSEEQAGSEDSLDDNKWESFFEHETAGYQLMRVLASDRDIDENADIKYSINSGKYKGKFVINPSTGIIYSQKPLFKGRLYNLIILATDNGKEKRNSTTRVAIRVSQVPETSSHSPVFKNPDQSVQLMESDHVGYLVTLAQAYDVDGHTLWYNITDGDSEHHFTIGRDQGNVQLGKSLDRETCSSYNLTISATDGVHTAYTKLFIKVLDVNEYHPHFSMADYHLSISESTEVGTEIFQLNATDADYDKKFIYNLHNSQSLESAKIFKINYLTGSIILATPLDREAMDFHVLTVVLQDGGTPAKRNFARVTINVTDINDHMPEFSVDMIETRLYSSAAVGTKVTNIVANDLDSRENGTVSYSILSGNDGGKFSIHPEFGDIILNKPLGSSSLLEYTLIIKATDFGPEKLYNTIPVHIIVVPPRDNPPKFLYKEITVEVYENSPSGTLVVQLEAYGWGILFEITKGNIDSSFNINPTTGTLTTSKPLDCEERDVYNLTVTAQNMAGGKSFCSITVHILDENDNAPHFETTELQGWILESAPVGSLIMSELGVPLVPIATDRDQHVNALLTYQFINRNHSSMFHVDPNTGAIRTVVCLDYEKTPSIVVTLIVVDKGKPRLTSDTMAKVNINVIDVNDSPPVFNQNVYNATVLVPTFQGVTVVKLYASDADSANLTYKITEGNSHNTYAIDTSTGLITINDKNKSPNTSHRLKVAVTDGKYTSESIVNVRWLPIEDDGEKGISFQKRSYQGAVLENSTQSIIVTLVSVTGAQLNEHVEYSILNPVPEFTIGSISGAIRTTGIPLDRESKEMYTFIVQAESKLATLEHIPFSRRVARTEVVLSVLDINDNCPVIANLEQHAVISISARKHHFITKITAYDADKGENGEVSYELEKQFSDIFKICPKSGNMTLKQQLPTHLKEYNIGVIVKDGGLPPCMKKVNVKLTVLDQETPVFEQQYYESHVPEDIPVNSPLPITLKALSPLNNDIIYTIHDGDIYEEFRAQYHAGSSSGSSFCELMVQERLDYENQDSYLLRIRATDAITNKYSEVLFSLIILDVNDNPPVFIENMWNISIAEDAPVGTSLIPLETTDADAESKPLDFFIIDGDDNCNFNVNSSGIVYISRNLNREYIDKYILTVLATDGKFSALSKITIDVLDVNDEKPECLKSVYKVQISEDVSIGTYVTTVQTFDPDLIPNIKFLLEGENSAHFTINNFTGEIRTNVLLDRETVAEYDLDVHVVDTYNSSWSCSSRVLVTLLDVNDSPPKFILSNLSASLPENSKVGSVVTLVHAVDSDIGMNSKLRYSLTDSAKGMFSIVTNTGLVRLAKKLDRELQERYTLVVRARDEGSPPLSSTAPLVVRVLDVNDNPPVFVKNVYSVEVAESAPLDTDILRVEAYSADIGVNAEIVYSIAGGNEDGRFYLDSKTGVLTILQPLDYEALKSYILTVEATDRGDPPLSSQALVNISVIDSNDNTPIFVQVIYTATVPENISVGSTIIEVSATDADSGDNGRITYHLEKGDLYQQFSVDPNKGYITVLKPLDRETISSYKLIIKATDSGPIISLSSAVTVNVEILDVNDNPPLFSQSNYSAVIQEGKSAGWSIIKLNVTDDDIGVNAGPFTFDIRSGNEGKLFRISSDGTVRTVARLSRRIQQSYVLQIRVFDSGTPLLFSDTLLTIKVIEESQYPPALTPMDIVVISFEDNFKKGVLGTVQATDLDPYDKLHFSLIGDPVGFQIDQRTGAITATNVDSGQYKVNVSATDGKYTSSVIVTVNIQPLFPEMLLTAFSIRLKGMTPHHFVLSGRKNIIRLLKKLLKTEIFLLSIQPFNKDLDILLSFQDNIPLDEVIKAMVESGLPVIPHKCECQNGGICRQRLSIIPQNIITTATGVNGFVAPAHTHRMYCACPSTHTGELCEVSVKDACDCPPPTVCSHQGDSLTGYFMCASPPPVAPLCAENHTCNSPSQGTTSKYIFSYQNIIIAVAGLIAICFTAVAIIIIIWKCRKRRRENSNEDGSRRMKEIRILNSEAKCNSKISNLKASQHIRRPSSYNCGNDTLYTALPLNNLDTVRNYGLAGEELENVSCDYVQNITKNTDPTTKITNDFKCSSGGRRSYPEEETRLMQGYQWDCTGTQSNTIANIAEVSCPEDESSSPPRSDIIIHESKVGEESSPRFPLSGYDIPSYGFPNQSSTPSAICDIDESETIS